MHDSWAWTMRLDIMPRSGIADLRLHPGRAPSWLVRRMLPMADAVCQFIVDEFGTEELLRRIADPVYFQALSNVLGYDWDSSGSTTVTCGVLKSVLSLETHGIMAVGGKGRASRDAPAQLRALEDYGMDGARLAGLSRSVAKVDSAAVQDGYQLYHHVFFVDCDENWAVVQQGMDTESGDARRYHWLSDGIESLIDEPHAGIISGERKEQALDMTAGTSEGCRRATVDLVKEGPRRVKRMYEDICAYGRTTLLDWTDDTAKNGRSRIVAYRVMPGRMNWRAVRHLYEVSPDGYEDVLFAEGMGAATVRGLALIAEVIYGEPPSWSDPVRMTFAFGGKDGVPFPVDRRAYDEAISFMEQAISDAKIGRREKLIALRRLRRFAPPLVTHETSS